MKNSSRHGIARIRMLVVSLALSLAYGCSHPIEITGEGDVLSASGDRDCSLLEFQAQSAECARNDVIGAYSETYTATPHPGWQFRRWASYCNAALDNTCSFTIPAATVRSFWGYTLPALKAVFRSTVNTGFTALFMGEAFLEPFAAGLQAHAGAAGFGDHHTALFPGPDGQVAPQAIWDDADQRAAIQSTLASGDIELLGMTYDPDFPAVGGYKNWIDFALSMNPDTRFFVATPWSSDPQALGSAQFAANHEQVHAQVHGLVDALRAAYPGVDIYCVPSGQGAVELFSLYTAGNLPDVSEVVGEGAQAVFSDSAGHPGEMVSALGQRVWLGAIYAVDLAAYDVDAGYSVDLNAIASAILADHPPGYNAPPEVDADADGDGIWDRLDQNPLGRPNILLIMADDLGYNDLAINNDNTAIDTPNLDQLAREGVRFTRHYAATVCSPARAALLTGLAPERLGYLPNSRGITPEVVTLPERLQEAGYTTWHIGKWHIGDLERGAWPDRQGFDHWFGFLNQWRLAGLHDANGELELASPTYLNPWLESDSAPGKRFTGHLETILTDKAISVLSDLDRAQAPWFLNLWYMAPHSPVQPASEFAQLYPNTPAGRYRALVKQLDSNIGRVMAHLEALGALQDTVVVVVSDNGGTNAELDNNAPFYGIKSTLTEGGLRTPLVIKWPEASINAQVISDAVSIEDIYPSLLATIGIAPPADLDGRSFYHGVLLREPLARRARFWDHIMTKDWVSYAAQSEDGRWRLYQPAPLWGAVPPPNLYDLALDPAVSQPLLPPPPAELAEMTQSYLAWYKDVHTVGTSYTEGANGCGVLTGTDFLRTPGFGTYTFGIGVPQAYEGPIATQAGVWELSRAGDTVTARFGDLVLSGSLQSAESCHSIVLTGYFGRRIQANWGPELMTMALYIDGALAQSAEIEAILDVQDPSVATVIGNPYAATGSGAWPAPVILNTTVRADSPWTLASFSEDLCTAP